ncbi:hypothetical protein MMC18_002902 [Xylographa bjoerkii]|nr:hypothetical protein [Xylographa bjoerkii]
MATPTTPPTYPHDQEIILPNLLTGLQDASGTAHLYLHHHAPASTQDVLTLHLPASFAFDAHPHYHRRSSESMLVLEGAVHCTINGHRRTLRAGDGWLHLPPYTRHSFEKPLGTKVVWLERDGPDPDAKKRFYRDYYENGHEKGLVRTLACFYRDGDTVPSLRGGAWTDWVGWGMVYGVGGLAHWMGVGGEGGEGEGFKVE